MAESDGGEVIAFPVWRAVEDSGRRTAIEVVYELVVRGVTGPGELEARSGYSETHIRNALRRLADAGKVRNIRHGVWEPAA